MKDRIPYENCGLFVKTCLFNRLYFDQIIIKNLKKNRMRTNLIATGLLLNLTMGVKFATDRVTEHVTEHEVCETDEYGEFCWLETVVTAPPPCEDDPTWQFGNHNNSYSCKYFAASPNECEWGVWWYGNPVSGGRGVKEGCPKTCG